MEPQRTVPYHGATEAPSGPTWSTLPEVVHTSDLEVHQPPEVAYGPIGEVQQKDDYIDAEEAPLANSTPSFWRRYRLWIIIGVVAAIVIIAVVVGTTVGLSKKDNGGGDDPPPVTTGLFGTPTTFPPETTRPPSACRGTICPTTLAAAQYAADNSFFLFGLGGDGAIWSRHANATQWVGDWESQGGSFASQPNALSTEEGYVDLFAVGKDGAMHSRAFRDGAWAANWVNLGGDIVSPPTLCSGAAGRIDVFAVAENDHSLMHKWYVSDAWHPSESGKWELVDGFISGSPVATAFDERIDITVYGGKVDTFPVVFNHYNISADKWTGWDSQGGTFRGDPGAVAVGTDKTTFFGLGNDKNMFSITYDKGTGYSTRIGLDGELESAPVIVATGTDRLDVLAVGTDDGLWHKARIGRTWAVEWESLGGYFQGAPAVVMQGDSIVNVFGVGPDGEVIHGNWTVTGKNVWGEGSWYIDGGTIETKWLRGGPA